VADLPGQKGTGKDQPFVAIHEGVQGIADFRLDLFFAAQKLDLFQEQDVAFPPNALCGHAARSSNPHHFVGNFPP
jgi:hypothetical protein